MGLTNNSVGKGALDTGLQIKKSAEKDRVIALAGNPNVGKSTVFNGLTGMKQHTGNWAGKTVACAVGRSENYIFVDIPGTYSLMAHSPEEEVARNFVCFGSPDATVVVCDATCIERNLNLVLQIMEICPRTLVCVNLLDEAKRKGINIDIDLISRRLGAPVVGVVARKKKSLSGLLQKLDDLFFSEESEAEAKCRVSYQPDIEEAISRIEPIISKKLDGKIDPRWVSLRLLDGDEALGGALSAFLGEDILADGEVERALRQVLGELASKGLGADDIKEAIAAAFVHRAEEICRGAVSCEKKGYCDADRRIDSNSCKRTIRITTQST